MARPLSDLLDRFRRTAGVPAAVADDLAGELAPVFAALEEIELAADGVRARARRSAEERLAEGHDRAQQIDEERLELAEQARSEAAAAHARLAEEEAGAILAAARREAERVRAEGHERARRLAADVAACVREWEP